MPRCLAYTEDRLHFIILPEISATQPRLRPDRLVALWAAGGVAGLARGLAAGADLQPVERLPGHRRPVRPERMTWGRGQDNLSVPTEVVRSRIPYRNAGQDHRSDPSN